MKSAIRASCSIGESGLKIAISCVFHQQPVFEALSRELLRHISQPDGQWNFAVLHLGAFRIKNAQNTAYSPNPR